LPAPGVWCGHPCANADPLAKTQAVAAQRKWCWNCWRLTFSSTGGRLTAEKSVSANIRLSLPAHHRRGAECGIRKCSDLLTPSPIWSRPIAVLQRPMARSWRSTSILGYSRRCEFRNAGLDQFGYAPDKYGSAPTTICAVGRTLIRAKSIWWVGPATPPNIQNLWAKVLAASTRITPGARHQRATASAA
jgi:hypothetical protein